MSPASAAPELWSQVCDHLNGMALAAMVPALEQRALPALEAAPQPLAVGALAREAGLRPAYVELGLRLLASQGYVELTGQWAALSPLGRKWRQAAIPYELAPQVLAAAQGLGAWLEGGDPDQARQWQHLMSLFPVAPVTGLTGEGWRHIQGPMVAAVMRSFSLHRLWEPLVRAGDQGMDLAGWGLDPSALATALGLLASQGWAWLERGRAGLRQQGMNLPSHAPQYFAPLGYLPTFRAAGDFLRGTALPRDLGRDVQGGESHVDRRLDIEFSGLVFRKGCAQPFMQAVLPIFQQPLDQQPDCVLDIGCGDATLIIELHRAMVQETRRGRHLDDHPLLMVGAEFNPQAAQVAGQRLAQAGVPHAVLAGDIADPQALARQLSARGIAPHQVLPVSKSVVHNRTLRLDRVTRPASGHPATTALFISDQGELIDPGLMLAELVDFFRRWQPLAQAHGMVVIEAHTVDPALAAPHRHRHLITCTDAYHGLSGQYLVEAEVHRWAYEQAGFAAQFRADLGQAVMGRPLMSVDYLRPAPAGRQEM